MINETEVNETEEIVKTHNFNLEYSSVEDKVESITMIETKKNQNQLNQFTLAIVMPVGIGPFKWKVPKNFVDKVSVFKAKQKAGQDVKDSDIKKEILEAILEANESLERFSVYYRFDDDMSRYFWGIVTQFFCIPIWVQFKMYEARKRDEEWKNQRYQEWREKYNLPIEETSKDNFLPPDALKECGVNILKIVGNELGNRLEQIEEVDNAEEFKRILAEIDNQSVQKYKDPTPNDLILLSDFLQLVSPTTFKYICDIKDGNLCGLKVVKRGDKYKCVRRVWRRCNNCLNYSPITIIYPPIKLERIEGYLEELESDIKRCESEDGGCGYGYLDLKMDFYYAHDIEVEDRFGNKLEVVGVSRFNFKENDEVVIRGRLLEGEKSKGNDGVLEYYDLIVNIVNKGKGDDNQKQNDDEDEIYKNIIKEFIYSECQKVEPKLIPFRDLIEKVKEEHPYLQSCSIFELDEQGELILDTNYNRKLEKFRDELDGYQGRDGKGFLKKITGNKIKIQFKPNPKETIKINKIEVEPKSKPKLKALTDESTNESKNKPTDESI